ncbi:MAG: hypothetical protein GY835_16280 [bacterium]|nr:hypothetical protein [bacterium]
MAAAVVLGGRGMGKSVFLRQLRAALNPEGDTRVILISAPPAALTVQACLGHLARRLGVPAEDYFSSSEVIDSYFARDCIPKRLVLLFDEFDRYTEKGGSATNPPANLARAETGGCMGNAPDCGIAGAALAQWTPRPEGARLDPLAGKWLHSKAARSDETEPELCAPRGAPIRTSEHCAQLAEPKKL